MPDQTSVAGDQTSVAGDQKPMSGDQPSVAGDQTPPPGTQPRPRTPGRLRRVLHWLWNALRRARFGR